MNHTEYETAKEASKRLGVMPRAIQKWAAEGKIPGAVRHGNLWMIPADAKRPKDGRYKDHTVEQAAILQLVCPVATPLIIMSPLYNKAGEAEQCVAALSDKPKAQALFAGQLAFMQGDVSKTLELITPLMDLDADFYGSLNLGMLASAVSVWKNDSILWEKGRARMASAPCTNDTEYKLRNLWLAITDDAIPARFLQKKDFSWAEFDKLPEESLPLYLFYYARHMHRIGMDVAREEAFFPDVRGMGLLRMFPYLAEPLIVHVHSIGSVVAEIYLHLLCADAYNKTGERDKSEQHLDSAISLCLADRLYGILAEYRGLMSNAFDERLERADKDAAKEVRRLEKQMYVNWMKMICERDDYGLSDRQKEVARLISIGLSNDEIAARWGISHNTVKSYVTEIMNKTGTTKRSELSSHIF